MLLLSVSDAEKTLSQQVQSLRLQQGFTQAGLAKRSGVPLASVRKFEQKAQISLTSLLKILAVLGKLEEFAHALEPSAPVFSSIEEVTRYQEPKTRKRGWRS